MKNLFAGKELLQNPPPINQILKGLVGGTIGILILLFITKFSPTPWIMAPFGATCVILFAVSASPLAQPRNVIIGHLISAFIGIFFIQYLPVNDFTIALSVGLAIALMQVCRAVHPPAGANPLVILLTANTVQYGWNFLFTPVLAGAVCLVLTAFIINNIFDKNKWPNYWFALMNTK